MVVGSLAGALSTYGIVMSPLFRDVDTCGINNLHGMPGIFGGLFSIVAPFMYTDAKRKMDAAHQAIGLAATIAVAGLTGAGTGYLLNAMGPSERTTQERAFSDASYFDCKESPQ